MSIIIITILLYYILVIWYNSNIIKPNLIKPNLIFFLFNIGKKILVDIFLEDFLKETKELLENYFYIDYYNDYTSVTCPRPHSLGLWMIALPSRSLLTIQSQIDIAMNLNYMLYRQCKSLRASSKIFFFQILELVKRELQ